VLARGAPAQKIPPHQNTATTPLYVVVYPLFFFWLP
jgi:hypothetical protein